MSADSTTVDSATVDSMRQALDWAMRELNARRRIIERLTHERDNALTDLIEAGVTDGLSRDLIRATLCPR